MKNITPFTVNNGYAVTVDALRAMLQKNLFVECGPTQTKSSGFVDPLNGEATGDEMQLLRMADGVFVFSHQVQKKKVPASIVKQELKNRVATYTAETGSKPGRQWRAEAKETITLELLPKCFPSNSTLTCFLDLKNLLLVVGTASNNTAEELVSILRKELPGFFPCYMDCERSPTNMLTAWVRTGEPPEGLTIDMDGEMTNNTSGKGVIKFANQSMTAAEVQSHLAAGYIVSKLALTWADKVSFMAGEDFSLTKLRQVAVIEDHQTEDKVSEFTATMTIITKEIVQLVRDLELAYGGPKAEPIAA